MAEQPRRGLTRRQSLSVLLGAGAGIAAMAAGKSRMEPTGMLTEPTESDDGKQPGSRVARRMPALFIAHGAPPLLEMPEWVAELRAWGQALPRPSAVLMVSAHWEARPATLGATSTVPLVYDFYGFPQHFYQQKYPSPGAPELAKRVRSLLGKGNVADQPKRGLDHGAYVPLVAMYPEADVPVLQLSLPSLEQNELLALGNTLAPLRDEGVLIIGSGFITHNLRAIDWSGTAPTPSWASDFDAYVSDALVRKDVDALLAYKERAPGVRMALPTHEHFVPLIVAQGAALDASKEPRFPIEGFYLGSLTRRSVELG